MKGHLNLWDLPAQQSASIKGIFLQIAEHVQVRLRDLGFVTGEKVTCLQHIPFSGPRIYRMGDSVFSLDRDVAVGVHIELTEHV